MIDYVPRALSSFRCQAVIAGTTFASCEQPSKAHRALPGRVDEAYRAAHRLACEEWSVRQFIGGPAEPSPRIVDAIAGGCELLEVRCRRWQP